MICQRCTHKLSLLPISQKSAIRALSTTSARSLTSDPPAATSTSAAQPFSTPFTPSPSKTPTIAPGSSSKLDASKKLSSVAAGTPLKGLGFLKGQDPPLAKEDSEYPDWLWGLLDAGGKDIEADGDAGDAFGEFRAAS